MSRPSPVVSRVFALIQKHGVLPMQDAQLPCAVNEAAGEVVSGSWWKHPSSHQIFAVINALADHADIHIAPLLWGKRAFVHRRHWSALIAVGRTRQPWQVAGLTRSARALLARVDREEQVRATGAAAKELEIALLVAGIEVHTESGAHAKELIAWPAFAKRRNLRLPRRATSTAEREFEAVVRGLGAQLSALPWHCAE